MSPGNDKLFFRKDFKKVNDCTLFKLISLWLFICFTYWFIYRVSAYPRKANHCIRRFISIPGVAARLSLPFTSHLHFHSTSREEAFRMRGINLELTVNTRDPVITHPNRTNDKSPPVAEPPTSLPFCCAQFIHNRANKWQNPIIGSRIRHHRSAHQSGILEVLAQRRAQRRLQEFIHLHNNSDATVITGVSHTVNRRNGSVHGRLLRHR